MTKEKSTVPAKSDTSATTSSHYNMAESAGRGTAGRSAEPLGSCRIGDAVITREQAMDALFADTLRWKAIPEEHDHLIIGIAEAARRSDRQLARKKGGRSTGNKRKTAKLDRRRHLQSEMERLPKRLRQQPVSKASIEWLLDQMARRWDIRVEFETLKRDIIELRKQNKIDSEGS